MTTEEKARAYDEALKCAKMYYKEDKDYNAGFLPIIFPELAESDDERIRKAIVGLIEELQRSDKHFGGVELTDMLAYLEKQKEQKPISQEDFDKAKHEALWGEQKPIPANSVGLKEQKPEWSEEDEKMLRTIISDGSRGVELDSKQISWLKSLRPSWKPSEEQIKWLKDVIETVPMTCRQQVPLESLYQDLKKLM